MTFTQQVCLFGSSDLQQTETALSNATFWKLLPLSTLSTSYVFRNTTRPSLQFFMAPQPIQKDVKQSILIHESGWYLKIHLGVRRVSQFKFNSTIFSLLSKAHQGQLQYLVCLVKLPQLAYLLLLVEPFHLNPLQPFLIVAMLHVHGHQLEVHHVDLFFHSCMYIFSHIALKTLSPK